MSEIPEGLRTPAEVELFETFMSIHEEMKGRRGAAADNFAEVLDLVGQIDRLRSLLLPLVTTDPAYEDDATHYRCAYCPSGVHSHDHHPACAWRIARDAMLGVQDDV